MLAKYGKTAVVITICVGLYAVVKPAPADEKPLCQTGKVLVVPKGKKGARVNEFVTTKNVLARLKTSAVVKWNDTGLSVLFECDDKRIVARDRLRDDAEIWKDDCVEVFLDVGHSHDAESEWFHVIVNAAGSVFDERGPVRGHFGSGDAKGGSPAHNAHGLKTKVAKTKNGWHADIMIPWDDIGVRPSVGEVWGFNLNREEHPIPEYLCFSPTWGVFLNIDQWGHIVFTDRHVKTASSMQAINARHEGIVMFNEFAENLKMGSASMESLGRTWVEIDGEIYGAKPDERGSIGGGKGYRKIVTKGDYHVVTLDELLDALEKAEAGQVVYVDGSVTIDCTERVYIEQMELKIPSGVTLASDRGNGKSKGALIYSDTFKTYPLIRCMGPDIRITGLRLRGPDLKPRLELHERCCQLGKESKDAEGFDHKYYYKFPNSEGIHTEHPGLEADNCEMAGWSHAAIYLMSGDRHHIHHNFIHHNQRNGLGYGVSHGYDKASSLIEQNLFNYNRHSIAGTGVSGNSYEARNNVEIKHSLSHCFDMHGGSDRKDGTDIAGDWLKIHHNTFRSLSKPIAIRGVPEKGAEIYNNWFLYHKPGDTTNYESEAPVVTRGKTRIYNNAYGLADPKILDPKQRE